jgi:rod shape-determining protein MreC
MKKIRLNIKPGNKEKKTIAIFVLFFILIIFFNFSGFSDNIKNFSFFVSSPIQKIFWPVGKNISDFTSGVLKTGVLKKEIEILHHENQELIGQIISLIELRKENKALREALGLGLEKEFDLMLARATGKDIFRDSILIDKGSKDGVFEGLPVITRGKALSGRIGQVYDNFSEVILISNKESSFDAKIFEESADESRQVYGIAKGKGGFGLYFDLIPKDQNVFERDIVVTSALGGIYPPGLLIGEIKEVKKSDIDPFQAAEIKPAFDIKDLDYLFIIKEW